jgi:hypothetical protein
VKRPVDAVQEQVLRTPVARDQLDPSLPHDMGYVVGSSLHATGRVGELVDTIGQAVPVFRDAADSTALVQIDTVVAEVHATVRAVNTAVTMFLAPALGRAPIDRDPMPYLDLAGRDLRRSKRPMTPMAISS